MAAAANNHDMGLELAREEVAETRSSLPISHSPEDQTQTRASRRPAGALGRPRLDAITAAVSITNQEK